VRHDAIVRVDLYELNALSTAQLGLVLLLQPRLADELSRLVTVLRHLGELFLIDLADVADETADRLTVRIDAFGRGLDDQAREILVVLLENRDGVERGVRKDDRRTVAIATEALNRVLELLVRQLDHVAQPR